MINDDSIYTPISCEVYSTYELAIMQRQHIRIVWLNKEEEQQINIAIPTDLQTSNGQEFLHVINADGQKLCVRLDYIQSCETVNL